MTTLVRCLDKCKILPVDGIVCYYAFIVKQLLFNIALLQIRLHVAVSKWVSV